MNRDVRILTPVLALALPAGMTPIALAQSSPPGPSEQEYAAPDRLGFTSLHRAKYMDDVYRPALDSVK